MPKNSLLKLSRQVHLYFGLFISPALLFFAFTGCYQTLGLHEPSSNYKPPALLASLGQIHKKQTYIVPVRRGAGGPEGTRPQTPRAADAQPGVQADSGPQNDTAHAHHGRNQGQPGDRPDTALPLNPAHSRGSQANSAEARPAVPAASAPGPGQQAPTLQAKQKQHLPLKVFFVIVSLGLFTSTLTGIYMAYKYDRNKILVTALLLAGVLVPVILLRF